MTAPVTVDIGSLITAAPNVYGGRPRLSRSGFPILQLVGDYQAGMRVAEFLDAYPQLDEESVYAGIAYYLANRAALDAELAERDEAGEELYRDWQRQRAG
jgi:uncharacterized protein (DUF433 family)